MPTIKLPHNFTPRPYQLPVLRALDGGATRAVAVWHRRAGKEKTFINYMAKKTAERVGSYFYFFPTFTQAKRAVWDGRDRDGFPFLAHFPAEYVKRRNETELKLELISGSIFQLVGTDNFDSIMSTNPIGCVFAEYSLQDPRAWDYIRPILRENGGWAIFDYTPRGKNHGHALFELAKRLVRDGDKTWYVERLTAADTKSEHLVDAERREGMDEDMIQQEYYCSFEGVQQGSVFGRQMEQAEREGRICGVPWQPDFPVSTWWDIGTGDPTAIWFTQDVGREVHVIDYYEHSGVGVGIEYYVKHLQAMPYIWGPHNGPHDIEAHSFAANGKSAMEVAERLGFKFSVVPRVGVKTDSINAARSFLARCWFDAKKTERGRAALRNYHFHWDDKRKVFSDTPYHDWSSNGADAFQTLAMGHKTVIAKAKETSRVRTVEAGSAGTAWLAS